MLARGQEQFTCRYMLLILRNQLTAMRGYLDGSNGELDNVLDMLYAHLGWMQYLLVGSLKTMILQ